MTAIPIEADPQLLPSGVMASEPASPVPPRTWLATIGSALSAAWDFVFGAVFLLIVLAALAATPVLQMLSLGYLLEVCGRVARSGRLRDGFVGIRKAARLGSAVLGAFVTLSPLLLLSHLGYVANLVNEDGRAVTGLRITFAVACAILGFHVVTAVFAGGRLRHFLWPFWWPFAFIAARRIGGRTSDPIPPIRFLQTLRQGRIYAQSRDALWDVLVSLRLPYYFWLGLRGFLNTLVWLLVPVGMLVYGMEQPRGAGPLVSFVGGLLMVALLWYLPFLQTRFAAERHWSAMFQLKPVRHLFARAPLAFLLSLLVTLSFAVPLYVLKIEATPQEITWLPALVFVAFTFPARLTAGWAVGRATRASQPRHALVRWASWLLMLPVAATYVLILFFTQYLSWNGSGSLFEQHAFLLPVPLF